MLDKAERIVSFSIKCYREKLFAGKSGNLSLFDRERGLIAITPAGKDYTLMQPEDIVWIDLSGARVTGSRDPSSEWRLHAEIYRAFPEVNAVVHTHSPFATSFALGDSGIPLVLIEMAGSLGGDVKVAPFAMPGSEAVGLGAVCALRGRKACLLQNHGMVAVGQDLKEAYLNAVYTEDAAKIYSYALRNGSVHYLSEEDILALKAATQAK
ncbi:MAG: class II aldolase/adducin family protein [Oscillospiraceae bacterium]|nr:class II aldolase/adducin family protein [Oscillospiraceae bacterium]